MVHLHLLDPENLQWLMGYPMHPTFWKFNILIHSDSYQHGVKTSNDNQGKKKSGFDEPKPSWNIPSWNLNIPSWNLKRSEPAGDFSNQPPAQLPGSQGTSCRNPRDSPAKKKMVPEPSLKVCDFSNLCQLIMFFCSRFCSMNC